MSLIYFVVFPILASFLASFFKSYLRYVSLVMSTILLIFALSFINVPTLTEHISFNSPLSITFVLNSASLFFLTLFLTIMTLFALYNLKEESQKDIFILTNMLLASVSGLVLSGDIFNIYIFFELASITAYILTSLNRDKQAYSGAIRYMIIGTIASIFLLIGIMSIYLNIGSLSLVTVGEQFTMIDSSIQFLILLSLFIGFGIKAEIFPLNFWVVDIYQATSTKINALFSSVLSKAYIFVFFHIAYMLKVDSKYLLFLAIIGVLSFAFAELSALSSRNLKRVFAFSTLGQIGLLFIALASNNTLAITGAIFLITVHAITKLMLFLTLDILEKKFKSVKTDIFSHFNSLFLLTILVIGFLSLLGLPPFGGFVAKLTILRGLASQEAYWLMGAVLLITLIEAVYLFRFIGMSQTKGFKENVTTTLIQKAVLGVTALSLLYLGLFPEAFLDLCQSVATSLLGVSHV